MHEFKRVSLDMGKNFVLGTGTRSRETRLAIDLGPDRTIKEDSTMAGSLNVGDRAPDFSLPQTRYEKVSLSDTLKEGKVVLLFYFLDFSGA